MKRWGFTFIELLVVIAIIAVLASILFPLFARARESGRRSCCASNLEQIVISLHMYAQSYDGNFPVKNNEFGPLAHYSGYGGYDAPDIFYCPSDAAEHYWEVEKKTVKVPGSDMTRDITIPIKTYSSYVYKGGLRNDDRSDLIIVGESRPFHNDLVNVLYLGGQVKCVPADGYKPIVMPTQEPVSRQPKVYPGPPGGPTMPVPDSK